MHRKSSHTYYVLCKTKFQFRNIWLFFCQPTLWINFELFLIILPVNGIWYLLSSFNMSPSPFEWLKIVYAPVFYLIYMLVIQFDFNSKTKLILLWWGVAFILKTVHQVLRLSCTMKTVYQVMCSSCTVNINDQLLRVLCTMKIVYQVLSLSCSMKTVYQVLCL